MTEIEPSASYLRNVQGFEAGKDATLRAICERSTLGTPGTPQRVWDLLETPQTVQTICRVLAREHAVDPDTCDPGVKSLLAQLYREDLIQLSPDS
jgi:hypothetical protein